MWFTWAIQCPAEHIVKLLSVGILVQYVGGNTQDDNDVAGIIEPYAWHALCGAGLRACLVHLSLMLEPFVMSHAHACSSPHTHALGCSFRITMYKCIYSSLDFKKLPFYPKNFCENQELTWISNFIIVKIYVFMHSECWFSITPVPPAYHPDPPNPWNDPYPYPPKTPTPKRSKCFGG